MATSVLVATPHQAFGELLRLSLTGEGHYRVRLVHSSPEATAALEGETFDIAILDGEMGDVPISQLGSQLLAHAPGLKLVLIPPENDPHHPSLAGMTYHGYILRPFYLPDLLEMMASLAAAPPATPVPAAGPLAPGWDAEKFGQTLAATRVLTGVVLVEDRPVLSGGGPSETVVAALQALAGRIASDGEHTDLVRFVRLPGQAADQLFYVTSLAEGAALGLTYPPGTPLSRVRAQAGQIARALQAPAPPALATPPAQPEAAVPLPEEDAPADDGPDEEEPGEDDEEIQTINLAALLGAVPSPDPGATIPSGGVTLSQVESEVLFPWDEPPVAETAANADVTRPVVISAPPPPGAGQAPPGAGQAPPWVGQAPPEAEFDPARGGTGSARGGTSPEDTQPLPTARRQVAVAAPPPGAGQVPPEVGQAPSGIGQGRPEAERTQTALPVEEPPVNRLEDTRPNVRIETEQLVSSTPVFSLLSYTCVLIPRLPQQHLTGALSVQIGQWVQEVCLAFGWRLEGIAVRPDYLQWAMEVSPSIAPANLVHILRGRLSDRIFESYPELAKANPSGDFWATGYLILSGRQPPSPRLLRDYIAETRRRQGLGNEALAQFDEAPGGPAPDA